MGILDKKTRFIDMIVTDEGRRQISSGKLRAEFISISDSQAFYEKGNEENVNERLYFQPMSRYEDIIVPEKDDSGRLFYQIDANQTIINNQLFVEDPSSSDVNALKMMTGSQFQSVFTGSLSESLIENFQKNRFLGSYNRNNNSSFVLNKENISFNITNGQPFENTPSSEIVNVNDAEPFFLDPHLTYFKNYDFLPPINEDGTSLGNYVDLRSTSKSTWQKIKNDLGNEEFKRESINVSDDDFNLVSDTAGLLEETHLLLEDGALPIRESPPKQCETIRFNKTSADNNIIIQIFENGSTAKLTKLDIIDAGIFYDSEDSNKRYEKRVLYVGKIMYDDLNIPTYINMFTIVTD